MPGIFDEYKIVLLDASFFTADFSEEFKRSLITKKVYIAETFNSEIDLYREVLPNLNKNIYESNVRFLYDNMKVNTLNLDSFGSQAEHLNNDAWGLITLFAGLNGKFAVITANQILIQRIMFHGIKTDIYDLNNNEWIRYDQFVQKRQPYALIQKDWMGPAPDIKVSKNSVLYRKNGASVTLDEEITSGLEGALYYVKGNHGLVAKIFKKDKLTADKYHHIQQISGINSMLHIDWAVFPEEVLYYDAGCNTPAGFTEKYVPSGKNLDASGLFVGDPFNITAEELRMRQSDLIEICLEAGTQVRFLNTFGFCISDFNLANFSVPENKKRILQMWDTDSFGYKSYFGNFFSQHYTESKNHVKYDTNDKEGVIEICNDAFYQFVFLILSLGDAPISEVKETFKYDNPQYPSVRKKEFFPISLWKHLEEVFRGIKPPSIEYLLHELKIVYDELIGPGHPAINKSVMDLYSDLIPDYERQLSKMGGGSDPPPTPPPSESESTPRPNPVPPRPPQGGDPPVSPPKSRVIGKVLLVIFAAVSLIIGILVYYESVNAMEPELLASGNEYSAAEQTDLHAGIEYASGGASEMCACAENAAEAGDEMPANEENAVEAVNDVSAGAENFRNK